MPYIHTPPALKLDTKMDAPNAELLTAFAALLSSGKYSDLTVQCGERTWAVHKAVICSRSGFFDGACSHPFKESATGTIDLSEDDPEAVEHMINYFYHLDYLSKAPKSRRTTQPSSPLSPPRSRAQRSAKAAVRGPGKLDLALVEDPLLAQAHAQSAISATEIPSNTPASPLTPPHSNERIDYFSSIDAKLPLSPTADAQGLDDDRFDYASYESESEDEPSHDAAPSHLVAHAKVYAIAEKYGITGLKLLARRKYAGQLFEDGHWSSQTAEFADSIIEVYESTVDTDRGLRDLVIQAFREHPELARSKDIELVVRDTPGAAWELFRLGWGLPVC